MRGRLRVLSGRLHALYLPADSSSRSSGVCVHVFARMGVYVVCVRVCAKCISVVGFIFL